MDADARPQSRPRPRPWAAAAPVPEATPPDITGEGDDLDSPAPFSADERADDGPSFRTRVPPWARSQDDYFDDPVPFQDDELADDGPDFSEPVTDDEFATLRSQPPDWVLQGETIESIALSNRQRRRERERREAFFPHYETFWGHVDVDPVSVVPTVRAARDALSSRNVALKGLSSPSLLPLMVNVVVTTAMALGIVPGPAVDRLTAAATCLIIGIWFAVMVSRFAVSSRFAAFCAVALACVVVSTVPTIHSAGWHSVLVGLAFAAAGLFVAAMLPTVQAWRVERTHWARPDVAMVAALLEFSDCVESNPAPQDRRGAVAALDRAATRFELAWHRVNRTGVDGTDRQLRAWAGRIRAETRELQRQCALNGPSTHALLMHTYKLILAIVNRYYLDDHEDMWVRHGSWRRPPTSALARLWVRSKQSGRYVRQCLLAGFIASAALLLLADTVWNGVPAFIGTHVSRDLGSALSFDPTVRVFVATISLSLFAVAGRAFNRRH